MGQFARFICHYEHLQLKDLKPQMFTEPIRCENFAQFCRARKGATNSASNAAKSVLQFLKWAKTEACFESCLQKVLQSEDVLRTTRQQWKKAIEVERSLRTRTAPSLLFLPDMSAAALLTSLFFAQILRPHMRSATSGSKSTSYKS
jgi:hypothetical protein